MVPRNAYRKHILIEKRLLQLAALSEKTPLNRIEKGSPKLGFITSGIPYQYLKENYPDASSLKLGFTYPFCDKKIARFAKTVKDLVVVEELDPIIEEHVRTLGIKARAKHATFRIGELLPEHMPLIYKGAKKKEGLHRAQAGAVSRVSAPVRVFGAQAQQGDRGRRHRLLYARRHPAPVDAPHLPVHGIRRSRCTKGSGASCPDAKSWACSAIQPLSIPASPGSSTRCTTR